MTSYRHRIVVEEKVEKEETTKKDTTGETHTTKTTTTKTSLFSDVEDEKEGWWPTTTAKKTGSKLFDD